MACAALGLTGMMAVTAQQPEGGPRFPNHLSYRSMFVVPHDWLFPCPGGFVSRSSPVPTPQCMQVCLSRRRS